MKQTTALYRLQQADSRIDMIRKRLNEITTQLGENAAVQKAQKMLTDAEKQFQHWQTTQKNAELERDQLKAESVEANERLYSGSVTNPRELEDLQGKIEEHTKRLDNLDTQILQSMLEKEEAEALLETARATMDEVLAEQSDTLGALTEEREQLNAELQKTEPERDEFRGEIEGRYLDIYDGLRTGKNKLAVAGVVEGNTCGACGVELNMNEIKEVRRGNVYQCTTCSRILHWT